MFRYKKNINFFNKVLLTKKAKCIFFSIQQRTAQYMRTYIHTLN